MTRSDSDDPDRDPNPFDLGLPMLRTPTRKGAKRRRSGRGQPQRRRGDPGGAAPEPLPMPEDSSYESGDWEQWLDQDARTANGEYAGAGDDLDAPERSRVRGYTDIPDDLIDKSGLIPELIDRSGGNPGHRLRHPRRPRQESRWRDKLVAALIMIGLGVVVVAVVLTVIHTGKREHPGATTQPTPVRGSAAQAPAAPAPSAGPAGAVAADGCEQRRTADVVSGTDPGGTSTGPDTILAFERAYYVQRSGFAARAVVADNANVPTAEQIQRGINQVPVGTRYCVRITRTGTEGQWEVRLTQQEPDAQPHSFTQVITTRTVADRTLIAAIASG
ncbi:hypothetical protein [Nocardia sp. NPDC051570]|uniref:hypothetical protein n=1 Tax=Nocardia sp. NPDC051570 TaxID=3364324 RepID=UPI0037923694